MSRFQILAHTADVRLLVEGDDEKELFVSALKGMSDIIKPGFCKKASELSIARSITISSIDLTTLLIDFLSNVLTHSHTECAVFCRVEFAKLDIDKLQLEAAIYGRKTRGFDEDIKAVTYHEANVVRNKKGKLETVIVFDI